MPGKRPWERGWEEGNYLFDWTKKNWLIFEGA